MNNVKFVFDKTIKVEIKSKNYVLKWCIDNKINFDVPDGFPPFDVPKEKAPEGWGWFMGNDLTFVLMALDRFGKKEETYMSFELYGSHAVCWQEIDQIIDGCKIRKDMYRGIKP